MEHTLLATRIGTVRADGDEVWIEVLPAYREGLAGLADYHHLQVLWWFSGCDNDAARSVRRVRKPYVQGPEVLGVFATRSPARPTPLALSCAEITYVDAARGAVGLAYLDAAPGSPVVDLKPYTPSLDRVRAPGTPAWCAHWPDCVEDGGDFDWDAEFNF